VVIDVVRALSFFAVIVFHTSYALWAGAGVENVPVRDFWSAPVEDFARALSFSGFTLLFLSFFLFGWKQEPRKKWLRLWLILCAFFAVWAAAGGDFPYIWDIYPYLLVVIGLILLVRLWPPWILALAGGLLTSVPFWNLEAFFNWPVWLSGPLFGSCLRGDDLGEDWPLLPWIGYPIFAYGLGSLTYKYSLKLKRFTLWEAAVWILVLLSSLPYLGDYFFTPLGNSFACYIFRRPAEVFWAHQIWVIFLIRLNFIAAVARQIEGLRWIQWLSQRPLNQYFVLAYFLHYPFCLAWGAFARHFQIEMRGWCFALGIFLCVVWIEWAPRAARRIYGQFPFGFSK
jgi:hypothetical protein